MARERTQQPHALEVRAFCTDGAALAGERPLARLARLVESLHQPPGDAQVAWQAQGQALPEPGAAPQWWLHLQGRAPVVLQCQRCLQPMVHTLEVDRRFRFVADEDEAERLDEQIEDDVLVLEPRLDLFALLEDELLLALPLVPRHEPACPGPLPAALEPAADDAPAQRPNPFAALAALRRGPGGGDTGGDDEDDVKGGKGSGSGRGPGDGGPAGGAPG